MTEAPQREVAQLIAEIENDLERARGGNAEAGGVLEGHLAAMGPEDRDFVLSRLSDDQRTAVLTVVGPGLAADLIDHLPDQLAIDALASLPPERAAAILGELPSDERADLLGELEPEQAEACLAELAPAAARDARMLAEYPDDVAGGLMVTEYLAFPLRALVRDVIVDLRRNAGRYERYDVQYVYVTDADSRETAAHAPLAGVLRLRDLIMAPDDRPIERLIIRNPLTVRDTAHLDELERFFDDHGFFGVPVVGEHRRLLGVVQRSAVQDALGDRSDRQFIQSQGLIEEELRTMPLALRARRRLLWLIPNIGLNVLAAGVVAANIGTIEKVAALAVFLPIVSDMSGCSGNQAVAVSIRELTMGVLRPREFLRVVGKEISVGMINGSVLGLLVGVGGWVWKGSFFLGAVVGLALCLNTMIAVLVGGCVPLLLKRFKKDPALASGPILTTVTDMCGFFLVLTLAAQVMGRLEGIG